MTVRNLVLANDDLSVVNGNLALLSDAAAVVQAVNCALKTFQGEWFLDPATGVPYFQRVLVKNPSPTLLRQVFRDAILGVVGVRTLVALDLSYSNSTRSLTVSWRAVGDTGMLLSGQTGLS